jgi:hypothetical protein
VSERRNRDSIRRIDSTRASACGRCITRVGDERPGADSRTWCSIARNRAGLHWSAKRKVASRNQSAQYGVHKLIPCSCLSAVSARGVLSQRRLGTRFRARGTFCQLLHLFDRGTIERTSRQRLRDRRRESSRCPGRCRISRTLAVERGILPRPQKLACGVDGRPSFPSFSSGNSSACGLGIQPRTRNPKIRKASGTSKDT